MHQVIVVGDTVNQIQISDYQLHELESFQERLEAINSFVTQYSMFCRSLSDFKKLTYSRAVDYMQFSVDESRFDSSVFLDAENAVMHTTASFMKFLDLLPSLLKKCFPNTQIDQEIKNIKSKMYDSEDAGYRFLCELRNAIVHRRVHISITRGKSGRAKNDFSVSLFGYFLNFDSFVSECVDKDNKRKLLMDKKHALVDSSGKVDLIKVLSDTALVVYKELINPVINELNESLRSTSDDFTHYVINNKQFGLKSYEDAYILFGDKPLYSSLIIGRTFRLLDAAKAPVNATAIVICPSIVK